MVVNMENAKYLDVPTGNKQRTTLLAIIHQNDVRLLEEAVLAIDQTDEVEILKLFSH